MTKAKATRSSKSRHAVGTPDQTRPASCLSCPELQRRELAFAGYMRINADDVVLECDQRGIFAVRGAGQGCLITKSRLPGLPLLGCRDGYRIYVWVGV